MNRAQLRLTTAMTLAAIAPTEALAGTWGQPWGAMLWGPLGNSIPVDNAFFLALASVSLTVLVWRHLKD